MSALAGILAMLLVAQDVTPSESAASPGPTCELADNACKARLFIEKAAKAPPSERAVYLFTAYRSYVALFARTGDARHLCAARTNFDRSLAVVGQSEQQRASLEKSRGELEALEQKHDVRCEAPRRRKRTQSAEVAEAPAALLTREPRSVVLVGEESEAPVPEGLLEVPGERAMPRPAPAIVEARQVEVPRRASVNGRPMTIAGGVTLGLGVGFVAVAGVTGSWAASASRKAFDDYEAGHGRGNVDAMAAQAELRRQFDRWLPVAVSTAVVGTTAVLVGAVLVRVGVRRMRQGPVRTALVPVPGGLAIHARF